MSGISAAGIPAGDNFADTVSLYSGIFEDESVVQLLLTFENYTQTLLYKQWELMLSQSLDADAIQYGFSLIRKWPYSIQEQQAFEAKQASPSAVRLIETAFYVYIEKVFAKHGALKFDEGFELVLNLPVFDVFFTKILFEFIVFTAESPRVMSGEYFAFARDSDCSLKNHMLHIQTLRRVLGENIDPLVSVVAKNGADTAPRQVYAPQQPFSPPGPSPVQGPAVPFALSTQPLQQQQQHQHQHQQQQHQQQQQPQPQVQPAYGAHLPGMAGPVHAPTMAATAQQGHQGYASTATAQAAGYANQPSHQGGYAGHTAQPGHHASHSAQPRPQNQVGPSNLQGFQSGHGPTRPPPRAGFQNGSPLPGNSGPRGSYDVGRPAHGAFNSQQVPSAEQHNHASGSGPMTRPGGGGGGGDEREDYTIPPYLRGAYDGHDSVSDVAENGDAIQAGAEPGPTTTTTTTFGPDMNASEIASLYRQRAQ